MIKNFEEHTAELNELELLLIPNLINGFKNKTKQNPIKAPDIVKAMNVFLSNKKIKLKFTEPKLRKCVNHIRKNGLIPLIATSNGYYVTNDKEEILAQIESLTQRANSMLAGASGLNKFL
jgi:hypothetical protein